MSLNDNLTFLLQDCGPLDARTAFPFSGGETAGLARLESYLFGTDAVAVYKETRNGLLGSDYSTKFSPWLANGSLSPRVIYHRLEINCLLSFFNKLMLP